VEDEMLNVSMRDSLTDEFRTERRVIRKQRVTYKELTPFYILLYNITATEGTT